MSARATRHGAGLAMALALALPAAGLAQPGPSAPPPAGAPVAGPAHAPGPAPRKPVGGRLDTVEAIEASLHSGYHAVLLLGAESFDSRICSLFAASYRDSFVMQSDKVIYFPRRAAYGDPTLRCDPLNAVYDSAINFDLNDSVLSAMPVAPILMIVCTDARNRFVNKGFLVFNAKDSDNAIKKQIADFDSYYRKGLAAWMDEKQIDKPPPSGFLDSIGDAASSVGDRLLSRQPKNTPCH